MSHCSAVWLMRPSSWYQGVPDPDGEFETDPGAPSTAESSASSSSRFQGDAEKSSKAPRAAASGPSSPHQPTGDARSRVRGSSGSRHRGLLRTLTRSSAAPGVLAHGTQRHGS